MCFKHREKIYFSYLCETELLPKIEIWHISWNKLKKESLTSIVRWIQYLLWDGYNRWSTTLFWLLSDEFLFVFAAIELVTSLQENNRKIAEALLEKAKGICSKYGVLHNIYLYFFVLCFWQYASSSKWE